MDTVITIFPQQTYAVGRYESDGIPIPVGATFLQVILSGRDTWGQLGFEHIVMSFWVEINTNGYWRFVVGGDTYGGPWYEDGQLHVESKIAFSLDESLVPLPYYRVVMVCHSVCMCDVVATFN